MHIKLITYLTLLLFLVSCTQNLDELIMGNEEEEILVIKNAHVLYEFDSSLNLGEIYAQLTINNDLFLSEIDSVFIESNILSLYQRLYNDGSHGDLIANNNSFNSKIPIEQHIEEGVYDILFYLSYNEGTILEKKVELVVGNFTPTINKVCIPETFTIHEELSDTFYVFLSVDDINGLNDIKTVSLEMKKEPGYETGEIGDDGFCDWTESIDEDFEHVIDLTFIPDYSMNLDTCELNDSEQEHNYIFFTPLVIDSFNDCGPHGPLSVKFTIEDYSSLIAESIHEMQICWPGECD